MMHETNISTITASLASEIPVNLSQGVCAVLIMLIFGKPSLEKLDRVKRRHGMMKDENGI